MRSSAMGCEIMGSAHCVGVAPQFGEVALWIGVLLAVVIAGALVIFALRRRIQGEDSIEGDDLDLGTLRRMRDTGQMTNEEFEAARAAIVARHGGSDTGQSVSPLDPTRVRARPGTDLTGDPLPRPVRPGDRPSDAGEISQGPKN